MRLERADDHLGCRNAYPKQTEEANFDLDIEIKLNMIKEANPQKPIPSVHFTCGCTNHCP